MTSVVYNHAGERFISGSADGTARIWRYARREWKSIIIDVNQRDGRPSIFAEPLHAPHAQHAHAHGGPNLFGESPAKIYMPPLDVRHKVNMAGWNADDALVLLAVSDFTIRIYNSLNGAQLHSVKVLPLQ